MKLLLGFLISPFRPLPSSDLVQEVAHGRSAQVLDRQVNQMGRLVTIKKPLLLLFYLDPVWQSFLSTKKTLRLLSPLKFRFECNLY